MDDASGIYFFAGFLNGKLVFLYDGRSVHAHAGLVQHLKEFFNPNSLNYLLYQALRELFAKGGHFYALPIVTVHTASASQVASDAVTVEELFVAAVLGTWQQDKDFMKARADVGLQRFGAQGGNHTRSPSRSPTSSTLEAALRTPRSHSIEFPDEAPPSLVVPDVQDLQRLQADLRADIEALKLQYRREITTLARSGEYESCVRVNAETQRISSAIAGVPVPQRLTRPLDPLKTYTVHLEVSDHPSPAKDLFVALSPYFAALLAGISIAIHQRNKDGTITTLYWQLRSWPLKAIHVKLADFAFAALTPQEQAPKLHRARAIAAAEAGRRRSLRHVADLEAQAAAASMMVVTSAALSLGCPTATSPSSSVFRRELLAAARRYIYREFGLDGVWAGVEHLLRHGSKTFDHQNDWVKRCLSLLPAIGQAVEAGSSRLWAAFVDALLVDMASVKVEEWWSASCGRATFDSRPGYPSTFPKADIGGVLLIVGFLDGQLVLWHTEHSG